MGENLRIMIDMGHPAHVHLFKNAIWKLQKKGHQVLVTARDKEVTIDLLKLYNIENTVVGKIGSSRLDLIREWIIRDYEILKIAKKFNPDILMGMSNPCASHIAWILGKKSILMDDTEHASFLHKVAYPFADVICTPNCFKKDLGQKQVRYNGCHELAYLHPNYFSPDPTVLNELGVNEQDNIFLVRFAAFNASQDTKSHKFKAEFVMPLIKKLEKKGKIIISSEIKLDPYLTKYQYSLSPDKYHSVLYYSKMYIGEGSTSAEEAALLGVPALHFERLNINGNPCGITPYIGIIDLLQNKYGLLYSYYDESELLSKVDELLLDINDTKKQWEEKRETFLEDMDDVTGFIVNMVENHS